LILKGYFKLDATQKLNVYTALTSTESQVSKDDTIQLSGETFYENLKILSETTYDDLVYKNDLIGSEEEELAKQ